MLKQYNVTDIELGAQSLDDGVLQYSQRGHTVRDVTEASNLITAYGFNLGLQMMIGLPQDTLQKSIHTARTIVSLKAVCTRIYPTLVIERTPLAALYRQGQYQPLSIEQAVHWTKEIYKIFVKENVNVLRVGLHPSEDLLNGKGYIAGPFHPSFFELVLTELWKEKFTALPADTQQIKVNPADINYAVGYCSSNLKYLKTVNKNIKILQDATVGRNNFVCL